jgi:magnesium-transporting ATPase (P-type)
MIDCLLTDLFTVSILKIYIVIRIIQCSLIIEMRTILIYSYCMWNALLIRSIKWFKRRSFQKQARTMTSNALSKTNMIIISSFESIKSLIIRSVWKCFIASLLHHYRAISVNFISQCNHTLNKKIVRFDCESSKMSR